jgi:hypothetical protein
LRKRTCSNKKLERDDDSKKSHPALAAVLLAALTVTACSDFKLGQQDQKTDPNLYPANYKTDLVAYIRTNQVDLLSARSFYVSSPALKQFDLSSRYFVCLRADGQDWRKEKFVVFFSGVINQFVDATSEQCSAAAYQPFPELLAVVGKK